MTPEHAATPEDLDRLFIERANARDVEGLVALYEPNAVLVGFRDGARIAGHAAIRAFYAELLTRDIVFGGEIRPAVINGDLALTRTVRPGDATAEVAHRQADGSWRWVIDHPALLS